MLLERNSKVCFCAIFNIKEFEKFNEKIRAKIKEFDKKYESTKDINAPLRIRKDVLFNSIIGSFQIRTEDISYIKKLHNKNKEEISKELEKEENEEKKELLRGKLTFLEKSYARAKEELKEPEGSLIIEFKITDTSNEDQILKFMNKFPEREILDVINQFKEGDFEFTQCIHNFFNKEKYSLPQSFKLIPIEFPKDIKKKFGNAFLESLDLRLEDSPLGLEEIEFGEDKTNIIFNISMAFKTNTVTELIEQFKILSNLTKNTILEK